MKRRVLEAPAVLSPRPQPRLLAGASRHFPPRRRPAEALLPLYLPRGPGRVRRPVGLPAAIGRTRDTGRGGAWAARHCKTPSSFAQRRWALFRVGRLRGVQKVEGLFICWCVGGEKPEMAFRLFGRRLARSDFLRRGTPRAAETLRSLSRNARAGGSRRSVYLLLAGGSCAAGVAWGLGKAGEEGPVRVLPVARAGGGEKGKAGEEKPKKVSARELRYKSFASYVYKGEPYMSSRDFLESLIRDEPRCELHHNTLHSPFLH